MLLNLLSLRPFDAIEIVTLIDASAFFIGDSQERLGIRMSLVCRPSIQLHGLLVTLIHASAIFIGEARENCAFVFLWSAALRYHCTASLSL